MQSSAVSSPHTFFADELDRALREQEFGIASFDSAVSTTALRAVAVVTLLEGNVITVSLSARGYRIDAHKSRSSTSKIDGKTFESIEQLLQSTSTLYESRRQEFLIHKLANLS